MWFSLEQIESLEAIQREGSISAAAESIHKAKSAVHYSIKKLEEQLGFELLNRKSYRGKLTDKGKQFLVSARRVLLECERLKEDSHRIATGVEMQLSISASALFSLKRLNSAILNLQTEYPDTEITFHREILSGAKMLRQGLVDLAIFEHSGESDEFEFKRIDEITLYLVIASHHQFLSLPQKEQVMDQLFEYPQVVQRSTIPDDDLYGVYQRSKRWTVSDLSSKREIILSGLGWGWLPEHEVLEDIKKGRLACLDRFDPPQKFRVVIARKKGVEHGVVSQALWTAFD